MAAPRKPKPKPRRLSKRSHAFESNNAEGKARQLANLTPEGRAKGRAKPGDVRNGKTMVQSQHPEMIVGLDGVTFPMRLEWFQEAVADAGVDVKAFGPLILVAAMEIHHWLCCQPLAPSMTYNEARIHRSRFKHVLSSLSDLGLTPVAQSKLGLRQAQEMATKHQPVRPRRDREHLQKVANLIDSLGLLPPAEVVDADVVGDDPEPEVVRSQDDGPDYGGDTPPELPEAARRDLGVTNLFDRGL
jgi:hypothetical protein